MSALMFQSTRMLKQQNRAIDMVFSLPIPRLRRKTLGMRQTKNGARGSPGSKVRCPRSPRSQKVEKTNLKSPTTSDHRTVTNLKATVTVAKERFRRQKHRSMRSLTCLHAIPKIIVIFWGWAPWRKTLDRRGRTSSIGSTTWHVKFTHDSIKSRMLTRP